MESIFQQSSLNVEWKRFDEYFERAYPSFCSTLRSQFPNLTVQETRLAFLIRLDLSNHQLSGLLDIETNSLKTAKYRLKRKLGLNEHNDLDQFLSTLSATNASNHDSKLST